MFPDSIWLPADAYEPAHTWTGRRDVIRAGTNAMHVRRVRCVYRIFACKSRVCHGTTPRCSQLRPPPPASLFAVSGVQNFSCNPTTGAYKFQGWLVNGTDFNTGKHAGAQSPGGSLRETGCDLCGQATMWRVLLHASAVHQLAFQVEVHGAGYGYTAIGPSGTNVPTFVATDESNSTVLGVADILREVGGLVMPR